MTVLQILPLVKGSSFQQVIFTPSARIYKLGKEANPIYLRLLQESLKNNSPVLIKRIDEASDSIICVEKLR